MWCALLLFVPLLVSGMSKQLIAQTTTADIVGTVKDSTGSVASGAVLTVTNKGTGEVRTVKSSHSGDFPFDLQP